MRGASDEFKAALRRGHHPLIEITSWYNGRRLATVPVVLGSWSISDADDQQVPGLLRFDVPNSPKWRPTTPTHPLAAFGQRVRVRVGVEHVAGSPEWCQLGWFRLKPATPAGEVLQIEAEGLLSEVRRSRFLSPWRADGLTRYAAVTRLCQGILPTALSGVANESMPAGVWERERLDALREIVDAWPARLAVDDDGVLQVLPPWNDDSPGSAVFDVLDGVGGTLASVTASPDTANDFNAYAVSTVPEGDAVPMTEVAYITTGPMRWGGPYGFNPGFHASPQNPANRVRLRQIATTLVSRSRRRRDQIEFTAAPNPLVQVGDVGRFRSTAQGLDITARVVSVTHSRGRMTGVASYVGGVR